MGDGWTRVSSGCWTAKNGPSHVRNWNEISFTRTPFSLFHLHPSLYSQKGLYQYSKAHTVSSWFLDAESFRINVQRSTDSYYLFVVRDLVHTFIIQTCLKPTLVPSTLRQERRVRATIRSRIASDESLFMLPYNTCHPLLRTGTLAS